MLFRSCPDLEVSKREDALYSFSEAVLLFEITSQYNVCLFSFHTFCLVTGW